MIQDLHAHTYYSFCCQDKPETVIETAIASGIQQLGICDHSYGVGCARTELCWDKGTRLDANYENTLVRYFDHIRLLRDKYAKRIKILTIRNKTKSGEQMPTALFFAQVSSSSFLLIFDRLFQYCSRFLAKPR